RSEGCAFRSEVHTHTFQLESQGPSRVSRSDDLTGADREDNDEIRERQHKQDIKHPVLPPHLLVVEKQLEYQTSKPEDRQKAAQTTSQQSLSSQLLREIEAQPGHANDRNNDEDVLDDEDFGHMPRQTAKTLAIAEHSSCEHVRSCDE